MKRLIKNKYFIFLLGIIFLIGVWFIISLAVGNNKMIFPSPVEVIAEMGRLLTKKSTYKYIGFSVIRLLVGFSMSFLLAFILGIIVNNNDKAYHFVKPVITFFKAAPTATFVFLFIVISGAKNAPVYVIITGTFPLLYESIVGGFKSFDLALEHQARVDGANKIKRVWLIMLPAALPYIEVGLIQTFATAFKIEIMAEVITGYTNGGLGSIINTSQLLDPTNLVPIFAYSLMAILVIIIFSIFADILKSKNAPKILHRNAVGVK